MSIIFNKKLPTPSEIKVEYPVPEAAAVRKAEADEAIRKVIDGRDDRFIVIIGPCSADNEEAVMDYLSRLAKVNNETSAMAVRSELAMP